MKIIREWLMYGLAVTIVVGFFFILYVLMTRDIPKENLQPLNIVLGALIGSFTSVTGYFFGSSKGSADKTEHLVKKDI